MFRGTTVECRQHLGFGREGLSGQRSYMTVIPAMLPIVAAFVPIAACWVHKSGTVTKSTAKYGEQDE